MGAKFQDLTLVGEGNHGKVYRLNETQCIKVYNKRTHLKKELKVLKMAEGYPQFPKLYYCDDNYIIRDFFDGPPASQYIKDNGLTKELAIKIMELIDAFIALKFTKVDCRLSHILVTPGENLKIIDPARNMSQDCNYPKRLLQGLRKIGYEDTFVEYIKQVRPDLWEKFTKDQRKVTVLT